jgi:hypothetical protein
MDWQRRKRRRAIPKVYFCGLGRTQGPKKSA